MFRLHKNNKNIKKRDKKKNYTFSDFILIIINKKKILWASTKSSRPIPRV